MIPTPSFFLRRFAGFAVFFIGALLQAAPVIQVQPVSQTVSETAPVTFSVTATGSGTLSYQWQKDGVDIPGATSSSFSLASARPWHIGDYTVKVAEGGNVLTSEVANLSITGKNQSIWKGLIYYYPLNGNTDDLGFLSNNLTATAASLVPDRNGLPNQAYSFSRAIRSKMISSNAVLIAGSTARSVSFWVKFGRFARLSG